MAKMIKPRCKVLEPKLLSQVVRIGAVGLEAARIGTRLIHVDPVEGRQKILRHSGSSPSFPSSRSVFRARATTIHHRTRLGAVLCLVASKRD